MEYCVLLFMTCVCCWNSPVPRWFHEIGKAPGAERWVPGFECKLLTVLSPGSRHLLSLGVCALLGFLLSRIARITWATWRILRWLPGKGQLPNPGGCVYPLLCLRCDILTADPVPEQGENTHGLCLITPHHSPFLRQLRLHLDWSCWITRFVVKLAVPFVQEVQWQVWQKYISSDWKFIGKILICNQTWKMGYHISSKYLMFPTKHFPWAISQHFKCQW